MGEQKLNILIHLSKVTVLTSDRIRIYTQAPWTWESVFSITWYPSFGERIDTEIAARVQDCGNISCFLLIKEQGGEGRENLTLRFKLELVEADLTSF